MLIRNVPLVPDNFTFDKSSNLSEHILLYFLEPKKRDMEMSNLEGKYTVVAQINR